ncbi:GINS complex, Sld5 component [Coprinellus micaceus]|uniref:DNA replication complex GINS protein SLD5 n=1 Tax=Coprinellus micaceus TaxID=71717 RepID=A0A4Y7SZ39_COPMI|nr:GINS complex, Sld5 component [Coprinellus micaceus]
MDADADTGPAAARPAAPLQEEEPQTPLQQMMRHWVNERHAPDILPAQEGLMMGLLDHLRRQTRSVQVLRDDPTSSESEHIRIHLVQTEIERVRFVIRSYVRTRLYKIEKYARYITSNAEIQTRLTASERDYASKHARLTDQHLYLSVLQSLPPAQAHLDDTAVFSPSMVTVPDKTRPIFVHALQDCPPVRLPDGATLEMKKGHISLTPYHVVEQLLERGEVELV